MRIPWRTSIVLRSIPDTSSEGTQTQLMAREEYPQVDTEAIPPSVSNQQLSGSSAGFISGRSTTVLGPGGSKSSPELPTGVLKLSE